MITVVVRERAGRGGMGRRFPTNESTTALSRSSGKGPTWAVTVVCLCVPTFKVVCPTTCPLPPSSEKEIAQPLFDSPSPTSSEEHLRWVCSPAGSRLQCHSAAVYQGSVSEIDRWHPCVALFDVTTKRTHIACRVPLHGIPILKSIFQITAHGDGRPGNCSDGITHAEYLCGHI